MATFTLLSAVSVDTVGAGQAMTGDFEALPQGTHYAGGVLELQVADTDTPADYEPVGIGCQWRGPGSPAAVRNNGTKFFRAVYRGRSPDMISSLGSNPSVTLKLVQ